MSVRKATYLAFIFGPFFRWWWALITGISSFLTFVITPQSGWIVTPIGALLLTLTISALLFLSITVVSQGWMLFRGKYSDMLVIGIQRNKELGAEWVFLIATELELPIGSVVDVHRRLAAGVEVPFALVEIVGVQSNGTYQGLPRSIAPAHMRDLSQAKMSMAELIVVRGITATRIRDFGTNAL